MLAAFLTTILFSISAIAGNRAARRIGGVTANFWRLVVATLALAAYAHVLGQGFSGAARWWFFVSGCIGFGIGDMALYQAMPRLGSRLSVMMTLCLSAPIAAAIEWCWLRTELRWVEVLAGATILIGVGVALVPARNGVAAGHSAGAGATFGLLAAVCQALGAVLSRKAFALGAGLGESIDGLTAAYQRLLGGLLVGAVFFVIVRQSAVARSGEEPSVAASASTGPRAWPWVLLTGLAGPALGVSCYQWALKTTPTGVVLPVVALTPVVIIPFSRYFEQERPTVRSIAGGLVAVAGAVLLAWRP